MAPRRLLLAALAFSLALPLTACEQGGSPGDQCARPEPESCSVGQVSGNPATFTGSTAGRDGTTRTPCGGGDAADLIFEYTAPEAGRYDITTEGSSFDTILSVRRGGCRGLDVVCNDDAGGDARHSVVTVELEACETVLVVVDGYGNQSGDVRVRISGRENVCDDGQDNDGDGLVDCADPDCFSAACTGDDWPAAYADFEWQVLELTNQRRAAGATCDDETFGPAGPLEMDAVIRVAARGHSVDMGERAYFEHDSLDGRTFSDRMEEAGYSGGYPWGENIAAGQTTPAEVVEGWMNSPGHCKNIMNPDFHVIGIGYAVVSGSPYTHYWTQDFGGSH